MECFTIYSNCAFLSAGGKLDQISKLATIDNNRNHLKRVSHVQTQDFREAIYEILGITPAYVIVFLVANPTV